MNGIKYFFDTNAVISLLAGNTSLEKTLSAADWVGISAISVIEFFSYPNLSFKDKLLFKILLDRIEVIGISASNTGFLEDIAAFKIESKLKLPDAIIAGYAIQNQATLVSNDKDFEGIKKLSLLKF
jgi:tRNA(fMet)-specific endonuclease VapC